MNSLKPLEERPPRQQGTTPLDSLPPSDRMRAVDLAMKHYFGTEDWLRERNRVFPGLARRHWFRQYGQ